MINDYDLDNRPKLKSYVQKERQRGETIVIRPLGPRSSPGLGQETVGVILNNYFLRVDHPDYPEDRLIVVLYHELGHIKFFRDVSWKDRTKEDSEYAAFQNSLFKVKEIGISENDLGPLSAALHFIECRQRSRNEPESYQNVINRIAESDLWKECKSIVEQGGSPNTYPRSG